MAVKTYSKAKNGNTNLSANFKVREFACKDGSDKILIDPALVNILQKIRDHFKVAVAINSGYRTPAWNKKKNGSPSSRHLTGMAADINVKGVAPLKVAQYAESIGVKGIGRYDNFVHVDTRTSKSFWIGHDQKPVSTFGGSSYPVPTVNLKMGSKGDGVKWLQQKLGITVDGSFGTKTDTAVRAFQRKNNLVADGIVGAKTREKLK